MSGGEKGQRGEFKGGLSALFFIKKFPLSLIRRGGLRSKTLRGVRLP